MEASKGTRWVSVAPDGTITQHHDEPTLERLSEVVGELEVMALPNGRAEGASAWINPSGEDAEGERLPLNPRGTAFLTPMLWPGQRVAGTVAFTGPLNEPDGGPQDLTLAQLMTLVRFFA
jgi:hypothetical protein